MAIWSSKTRLPAFCMFLLWSFMCGAEPAAKIGIFDRCGGKFVESVLQSSVNNLTD